MKIGFYSKIATDNIRKNRRLYLPRILAEAGLLGCFYILFTLSSDERLAHCLGGSYLPILMAFGAVVLGLLSFVLILYINGFLMKQRKHEYGLYNVLGMEKRHIVHVLFWESAFTALISIVTGLLFGALFYKLSSLLICKLLHADIVAGFYYLSFKTVLFPGLIFIGMDGFAFLVNSLSVRCLKPVDLLAGKQTGEKEPKIRWILLIIGLLTLGAGYYIALTVKSPLEAIFLFFAAVILVIIGTYCLFVTGTTFVLKTLKQNKKYYYNKKHMPAVAGLLFRMKQNAVGLASIAILSTGVLVMISTTVSLYSGVQDTMETNYPQQLYLSGYQITENEIISFPADKMESIVRSAAKETGLTVSETELNPFLSVSYAYQDGALITKPEMNDGWELDDITGVIYITESTYSQLTDQKATPDDRQSIGLKKNEIAVCRISTSADDFMNLPKSMTISHQVYAIKEVLTYFPVEYNMGNIVNVLGIVVADDTVMEDIYKAQKDSYGDFASEYSNRLGVSFTDEEAAAQKSDALCKKIIDGLDKTFSGSKSFTLITKWEVLANVLGMYGSFLFLGVLLGLVCLFATILIIYYKQISEGYEDRDRFQIMQKIGMTPKEVKKTIRSQLILQFFLPLITAGIHTAFAFPILLKLLKILMLTNTSLFVICTLITLAVFATVYTLVYRLTSKTYYKIVH